LRGGDARWLRGGDPRLLGFARHLAMRLAHTGVLFRRMLVRPVDEEKWIRVPGREGRAPWRDGRLSAFASERGVKSVSEGQPRHGGIIGRVSRRLRRAPVPPVLATDS
jgi:hypothetical protein